MKVNYFAIPGISNRRPIKLQTIKTIFCEALGITWEELISPSREQPFPDYRKMLVYLVRKYCKNITLVKLGKELNRDHATIIFSERKANDLKETDRGFCELLTKIETKLKLSELL